MALRRGVVERKMPASAVVERFDVVEGVSNGFRSRTGGQIELAGLFDFETGHG